MTASIRVRITAIATIVIAVVLCLATVIVVVLQRRELIANVDDGLEQRADGILASLGTPAEDTAFVNSNTEDRVAQVVNADGAVVAATANLAGIGPVADPVARPRHFTVDGLPIEDDDFRVLSTPVTVDGGPATLHVAESIDDMQDEIRNLVTVLGLTVPAVSVLAAVLVWWLVGRTLRPVEAIRAEVAAIGLQDLDHRVPVPATADEIGRLATTMNEMLSRLETSASRQRQFSADASHELRTPLARLRAEIDVARADAGPESAVVLDRLSADVDDMTALVTDLLWMARADAGVPTRRATPIDLDDIVLREARRQREQGHVVDLHEVTAAEVTGDQGQLTRLVRNLLDNAGRHGNGGVWVALRERDGYAELAVHDDGAGIAPDDRERVFERFARVDDARARTSGGTGLGLPIAREIAAAHGGTILITDSPHGGAAVVLRLPSSRGS